MQKNESEALFQRDALLALIEHELRNPLAAISFSLDSLRETESLSESGQQLLEIATRQTNFVAQVLDALADIFQIHKPSADMKFGEVDVNVVVTESLETVGLAMANKRQRLNLNLAETAIISRGDPVRLQQAIVNLLDNARKFSPDDGEIWVETEQLADAVMVVVRDSGSGIDPAIREKIFDLFFGANGSAGDGLVVDGETRTKAESGKGIGLFLVQQIAEMHSGSVEVVTPRDHSGSEFRLVLKDCLGTP